MPARPGFAATARSSWAFAARDRVGESVGRRFRPGLLHDATDHVDGERRRDRSPDVAAHAVGHGEQRGPGERRVLVVGAGAGDRDERRVEAEVVGRLDQRRPQPRPC